MCEQAQQILENCRNTLHRRNRDDFFEVKVVDIVDDAHLLERYGVRIPVLALVDSDKELDWPFDENAVLAFVETLTGEEGNHFD